MTASFEWDFDKDVENRRKHGVGFSLAQEAFLDPKRVIARDVGHSKSEDRFYCAVHLQERRDSHHWRWILAQGQANL